MSKLETNEWVDIIMVHTKDPEEKIARCSGTGNWKVDRRRGAKCDYVVITQNGGIERGRARLVGKIESIDDSGQDGRKLIRCSAFARVDIPGVWGGWQNPVYYGTSERIGMSGKQLAALPWESRDAFLQSVAPLPDQMHVALPITSQDHIRTVDLATAKAILAAHFQTRSELIALIC